MAGAARALLDPKIERLLYIHKAVTSLVQRAGGLLDPCDFPASSRATAVLAKEFEAEIEASLLRAYDDAPLVEE
jgi:hypothetical protein